jgi:hypothetical protein
MTASDFGYSTRDPNRTGYGDFSNQGTFPVNIFQNPRRAFDVEAAVRNLPLSHPQLPIAGNPVQTPPQTETQTQPTFDSFGNFWTGQGMSINRDTGGTDMGDLVRNGFMSRDWTTNNDPNDPKNLWRTRMSLLRK